jgi:hypothetical protein
MYARMGLEKGWEGKMDELTKVGGSYRYIPESWLNYAEEDMRPEREDSGRHAQWMILM